jgi:uncharacterized protein DUF4190/uncharacterized protein DUF4339
MYRIIGADGKDYGPFSADQLRQWITENRANASTPTLAQGATEWKPLGSLPEFSILFSAPAAAPPSFSPAVTQGLRTNGFAMAGLVIGLVSCFFGLFCCCCGPMIGIVGIIFSLIGLSQINSQPDVYSGKGLAIAGLVLSILGLAFYLAMMVLGLALGSDGGTHHVYRL